MARYRSREWVQKMKISRIRDIENGLCKKTRRIWVISLLTLLIISAFTLSCKIAHRTLQNENPYAIEAADSEQSTKLVGTNLLDDVSYSTTGEGQVLVSFSKEPDYSGDWDGNIFILRVQNCKIGKKDGKIQPSDYLKRVQWAQHENDVVWVVLEFASKPDLKVGIAGTTVVLHWKRLVEEPKQPELVWSVDLLPDSVTHRMKLYSWRPGCPVPIGDLRYLVLTYIDFDGEIQKGELVVHYKVAYEVAKIFKELFEKGFPIERMKLIEEYEGSDAASMANNNTSGFNCRNVAGSKAFSKHAYGLAIDINPLINPCVRGSRVSPSAGKAYLDRTPGIVPGMVVRDGPCYTAFVGKGWTWGGNWRSLKDYQHFEKPLTK